MSNSKTCTKCNEIKSLDAFPKRKKENLSYKNQTNSQCKACLAERARAWRKKHPGYRGTGQISAIPEEDRLLYSAIGSRLIDCKMRAKKAKQVLPTIDKDYLYNLFLEQNRCCALTGVPLRIEKRAITCLSLDKIKPDLGYRKENVQWVAWAVNRAKGDMSEEVFIDMCRQVFEYRKVQRLSNGVNTTNLVE